MRTIALNFTAGQTIEVVGASELFLLLETVSGIDIKFFQNGSEVSSANDIGFGYWVKPSGGFTSLSITSAAAQAIKISIGLGEGGYNRTTGVVQILNQQGAYTQTQKSVTNASQLLIAANATRRGGLIQNNDSAAVLRVTVDGTAASATRGFRVLAGGVFNLSDYAPSGAIYGCMETATGTANNVEVAEG